MMRTGYGMGRLCSGTRVLLCGVLYVLLLFDASGFLRLGLLAAILHEWGHIFVYCAPAKAFPVIEVTLTGFCMRTAGQRLSPVSGLCWPRPGLRSILYWPGCGCCAVTDHHHPRQRLSGRRIC